jgi:cyclohexadieny/prephenate dehydrogenase
MPPASRTEAPAPIVERLALIGAGLIGSAIARAARATGAARAIVIADASAEVRARVETLGFADHVAADVADAARDADLVVLCMPVARTAEVLAAIAPALRPTAVVTDVGSVKASVARAAGQFLALAPRFVPAHPVAGTEHSGPDAGRADLFAGRWCLLTPVAGTAPEAIDLVGRFWERLGSRTATMSPEHHDTVLAVTSHLPHLIAYTIVATASDLEQVTASEIITYSAGGFRDFTRVAASDPAMWRDILIANREAVLAVLARLQADIAEMADAMARGDGAVLEERFARARAVRRGVLDAGQA